MPKREAMKERLKFWWYQIPDMWNFAFGCWGDLNWIGKIIYCLMVPALFCAFLIPLFGELLFALISKD